MTIDAAQFRAASWEDACGALRARVAYLTWKMAEASSGHNPEDAAAIAKREVEPKECLGVCGKNTDFCCRRRSGGMHARPFRRGCHRLGCPIRLQKRAQLRAKGKDVVGPVFGPVRHVLFEIAARDLVQSTNLQ